MTKDTLPQSPQDLIPYLAGRMADGFGNLPAEETLKQMVVDCKQFEADQMIEEGDPEEMLSYVFNVLGRAEFLGQLEEHFVNACQKHMFPDRPDDAYLYGLQGFEDAEPVWPETMTSLVRKMIETYGFRPDPEADFWGMSEEENFLLAPNGRLALMGRTAAGHPYVVESP